MRHTLLLLLAAVAPGAAAQEATVSLGSTVSGNREQPRVAYIVPWQQPAAADLDYELDNTIAQELFAPLDRDEFTRALHYQSLLEYHMAADPDTEHSNPSPQEQGPWISTR